MKSKQNKDKKDSQQPSELHPLADDYQPHPCQIIGWPFSKEKPKVQETPQEPAEKKVA